MRSSFCAVLTALLIFTGVSLAAPEPAVVQGPNLWTLNIQFTNPQFIEMPSLAGSKPIRYWYMIITLTNNSNRDVDFYPKCDLVTDTFQTITAGIDVGTMVFNRIKDIYKSKYPFLEQFGASDNKMLQGQDNTRDIAVIWKDFDPNANNIKIFITGLSNETAEVSYPAANGQDEEAKKIYLRKTLELQYKIRGNPASNTGAVLDYVNKTWVMR